jgi:hypothetical protein
VQAEEVNEWLTHEKLTYRFGPGLVMQAEASAAAAKKSAKRPALKTADVETEPWFVPDPRDAALPQRPKWFVAARFFARQEVRKDKSLSKKRDLLADKVSKALLNVGIKTPEGRYEPGTILKAIPKSVYT